MDGDKVAELDALLDLESGMKRVADAEEVEPGG
jgi:hypothetical protein